MNKRAVAAISGGVHSSFAVARLVDQGYDVVRTDSRTKTVKFLEPLTGLVPGQTIALYGNTRVIGRGTVLTTTRS